MKSAVFMNWKCSEIDFVGRKGTFFFFLQAVSKICWFRYSISFTIYFKDLTCLWWGVWGLYLVRMAGHHRFLPQVSYTGSSGPSAQPPQPARGLNCPLQLMPDDVCLMSELTRDWRNNTETTFLSTVERLMFIMHMMKKAFCMPPSISSMTAHLVGEGMTC